MGKQKFQLNVGQKNHQRKEKHFNKLPSFNLSNPHLKENLNKSSGSHLNTLIITKGIKSDKKESFNVTSFHFPVTEQQKKLLIFTEETTTEPKKNLNKYFSRDYKQQTIKNNDI